MSKQAQITKLVALALLSGCSTTAETKPAPAKATHLYLDVHELGGKVAAADVAAAHAKDLVVQGKYGVDYKAYWVDEAAGKIYCLVEAPSADAANRVHQEAHGLVAKQILEVAPGAKPALETR